MSTITRAEKERARPATLDMGRAVAVERAVELGLEAGLLELDFEPDPEERWWLTERGAEAIGVEWGGRRGPGTLEYELDQALG